VYIEYLNYQEPGKGDEIIYNIPID
jgi:hypothetical protein